MHRGPHIPHNVSPNSRGGHEMEQGNCGVKHYRNFLIWMEVLVACQMIMVDVCLSRQELSAASDLQLVQV